MPQDKALTFKRLGELWDRADIPVLDTAGKKYFVFSDTHLGDKSGADDFTANEETLKTALDWYRDSGYELILLGDIEEFWQFRLDEIADDEIRLAKWHRDSDADPRHEIYQRGSLSGFLAAWP